MFENFSLNPLLLKTITELGFDQPTPVQIETIPRVIAGKDLLVSAETGSGKTAAFLLPILHRLLENPAPDSGTRALILVPTRELARQIHKQLTQLGGKTRLGFGLITGGESFKYQRALFRKNPEILIATPGRLLEHLEQKTPEFDDLEVLVIDEADRMLDMGLSEDVLTITRRCNQQRQTLLFSATLSHRGLNRVTRQLLKEPETLALNRIQDAHSNITQQIILSDDYAHKKALLLWLLQQDNYDKALVFTNTRLQADSLGLFLSKQALRSGVLHGEMEQTERNLVMLTLRQGGIKILVATDVAARGLDVKGIDLVINFEMARNGHDYVHRIGRTGRAGEQGLAIALIAHHEWNLMAGIERYLELQFERRRIKGLEGKYRGPKKLKSSGKAAGSKKNKDKDKDKNKDKDKSSRSEDKTKQRHRNRKNIGKRRTPSGKGEGSGPRTAGLGPLKKKT